MLGHLDRRNIQQRAFASRTPQLWQSNLNIRCCQVVVAGNAIKSWRSEELIVSGLIILSQIVAIFAKSVKGMCEEQKGGLVLAMIRILDEMTKLKIKWNRIESKQLESIKERLKRESTYLISSRRNSALSLTKGGIRTFRCGATLVILVFTWPVQESFFVMATIK